MAVIVKKNDRGFSYVDVGCEGHGRPSFRMFVHPRFISDNGTLEFPVIGAKIERTEKGTIVLRPNNDFYVTKIGRDCGYRGSSDYKILCPEVEEFPFYEYRSPRGNCGVSRLALVNIPRGEMLKYEYTRTGRLYGAPGRGVVEVDETSERELKDIDSEQLEELENIFNE